MIHLFDNKFLQLDKYINTFNYRIVISETYATDDLKNTSVYPKTLKSGKNLEDAMGEGNDVDFLIRILFNFKEKVIIFADIKTYSKIITTWLKSTTNMDKESFDYYADCFAHNQSKLYNNSAFASLSYQMKDDWVDCPEFNFLDLDFMPSIEFMFASASYDINFNKKTKLQHQLAKLVKRQYELVILETKSCVDTYILDSDMQAILGGSDKEIYNYYELPRMAVYRQPYFRENINALQGAGYLPGADSKLDLSLASDEEIEELCKLTDDIALSYTGISNTSGSFNISIDQLSFLMKENLQWPIWLSDKTKELLIEDFTKANTPASTTHDNWKYMPAVKRGVFLDEEYNSIISEMLAEKIGMTYMISIQTTVLFTLLIYFKSLKQTNSLDKLKKFTLK
jgi:hypothetical protein